MNQTLKAYTAPDLEDWGKVVDVTLTGASAFGGKKERKVWRKARRKARRQLRRRNRD